MTLPSLRRRPQSAVKEGKLHEQKDYPIWAETYHYVDMSSEQQIAAFAAMTILRLIPETAPEQFFTLSQP